MKKILRTILLFVAFSQLLSSCFTYTNILKNKEVTENYTFSEKDFEIGNRYEIITKDGMFLLLKLNEISAEGIIGSGTLKILNGNSETIRSDAYTLGFDEIQEVHLYKFNLGITALISSIMLAGFFIYLSNNLNLGITVFEL